MILLLLLLLLVGKILYRMILLDRNDPVNLGKKKSNDLLYLDAEYRTVVTTAVLVSQWKCFGWFCMRRDT